MNPLLAFAVYLTQSGGHGGQMEHTAAMDWFVLATLGCLFFLLGCFATWGFILWHRGRHPEPHMRLLMELEEDSAEAEAEADSPAEEPGAAQSQPTAEDSPPPPWERPADWWKTSK